MKKIILLFLIAQSVCYTLLAQNDDGDDFLYSGSGSPNNFGLYTSRGGFYSGQNANNSNSTYNSYVGYKSGYSISGGSHNSAFGVYSLYSGTSGSNNTAIGSYSLYSNTTGIGNTASGYYSLYNNTTANYNTAYGYGSLQNNTSGTSNTATGYHSLYGNTTASYNTAYGYQALAGSGTNSGNTAVGAETLVTITSGQGNTATGYQALFNNSDGNYNTAVGYLALSSVVSGSQNTAIGYNAGMYGGSSTLSNTTAIGYNAVTHVSNSVVIGNSSVTSIGGQVGWSTLSDGRFKTNVKEDVSGLGFINQLRPVSYTFDTNAYNQFTGIKEESTSQESANNTTRHTGFIAQEVETAVKNSGLTFSGVVAPQNDKDHYSLRYGDFVVPLVKAVQELSSQLKQQANEIDSLKKVIANSSQTSSSTVSSLSNSGNVLYQNIPNPANGKTIIPYQLQDNVQGQVYIFDMTGNLKKTISLSNESNSVEIQNGELSSGLYIYSLVVNGIEFSTKRMIIN